MEIKNCEGEHILWNLNNRGDGEFKLGNLQNICMPPFYMGLDSYMRPICVNIAFDPARSGYRCEDADEVGLYNVLSLRINGFPVPGSVFPELKHMCDYQVESANRIYWPSLISMDLLKQADEVRIGDISFVYALNNIVVNPQCTYLSLFSFNEPFGFLGCRNPDEEQSSVAALRMPIGLDFLGPFEEELEEMLATEGKEPFAIVACPEGQTFQSAIEAELKMAYKKFDRIQEYENLRLFQFRDSENYNSYICVKWIENRRMLFYELESYDVEECQKKRITSIFENYKILNNNHPIQKKTVKNGSNILHEMDGALFVLSGRTYALWMQNGDLKGVSEYLSWNIEMTWDVDKLNFDHCRIVDNFGELKPKIVRYTSIDKLPCFEKLKNVARGGTFTEGEPYQKIWFQKG